MKKTINLFLILATVFSFTSCVKDQDFLQDVQKNAPEAVGFASGLSSPITLDVVADGSTLEIPVSAFVSADGGAGSNITVNVVSDPSIIDAYNATYGNSLEAMPESSIESSPSTITIPSGSNSGSSNFVINLDDMLQYGTYFAVGVRITSASGAPVSTTRSEQIYIISVRNQYDGLYNSVGVFTHPTPDYSGPFDRIWEMTTNGPDAVDFQLKAVVDFGVYITVTVKPDNTLDYYTEQVILDPWDPALNYYDPATRSFHMDFTYSLGTRHCVAVATYIGPR